MIPFRILRIIERAGHKMEFVGRTANLTVARLALAVLRVDHMFEGMAFSIRASEEVTTPQVSATQEIESQAATCMLFQIFTHESLRKTKVHPWKLLT